MRNMKTRDLAEVAVFAALLCAAAPFSIPIGPVPITLATLVVYIAAASLGAYRGTLAVIIYIMLGAFGVPVFSKFSAGLPAIVGPTGGYLVGYIPLALVTGLFADRPRLAVWKFPAGMGLGTAVLYTLGTAWFMFRSGNTLAVS
ncbi:MAG: biotin transporter BioY, partial [Oscillospiraceae bacterium]|nr:biotin transporter BioY [Oscillospiraceae bacterium]